MIQTPSPAPRPTTPNLIMITNLIMRRCTRRDWNSPPSRALRYYLALERSLARRERAGTIATVARPEWRVWTEQPTAASVLIEEREHQQTMESTRHPRGFVKVPSISVPFLGKKFCKLNREIQIAKVYE